MHSHPIIEFFAEANRILSPDPGKESWNIGAIDERTWRRWRNGDVKPDAKSLMRVATSLWSMVQPTTAKGEGILAALRAMDPTESGSIATKEAFVKFVEDVALRVEAAVDLGIEIRRPGASRFTGVESVGVAPVPFASDVRVVVRATHPVYLHVLWVDSAGNVTPLYPWVPGDWGQVGYQKPDKELSLPQDRPAWQIDTGAGTETVVVVKSTFKVSGAELGALKDRLERLPSPTGKTQGPAVQRFVARGGRMPETRLNVAPEVPEKELLAWRHRELETRLGRIGEIVGVSFANAGRKEAGKA